MPTFVTDPDAPQLWQRCEGLWTALFKHLAYAAQSPRFYPAGVRLAAKAAAEIKDQHNGRPPARLRLTVQQVATVVALFDLTSAETREAYGAEAAAHRDAIVDLLKDAQEE